jgi:hypothetical protein
LLSVGSDVDACTRGWHTLDANEDIHFVCFV